jgi:protein-S-isoprenylcysteine O-methyltransferase Ste14
MDRAFIIRALSLYVPIVGCFLLWSWRKPAPSEATGALLASAWNLPALLALNVAAGCFGWWRFNAHGALFLGVPVDLWLGWSALWGAGAALLFPRAPVWLACASMAACDLLLMPLCSPVVVLGRFWLVGEIAGLVMCLVPALYFARWTRERTHAGRRAALQFVTFSGLFLIGLVIACTASPHARYFYLRSTYWQTMLQLLFILALPGLSAVQEFAVAGNGTPLPYDPPASLVASGIYAYIANPMQTSTVLLLFALGLALHSIWVALAGVIAAIYCVGLAAWDEDKDLKLRYGPAFVDYRRHVRNWIPRWRPHITAPARVYVSAECFKCSQIAGFLRDLKPLGLHILPAEEHPSRDLERMTYESPNDEGAIRATGIAALARAVEHVNLGWALFGMALRLPIVNPFLQAIVDVSDGGPFRVTRRPCSVPVPHGSDNL